MKLLLLISAQFVATAVVAGAPVETADEVGNLVGDAVEKEPTAGD